MSKSKRSGAQQPSRARLKRVATWSARALLGIACLAVTGLVLLTVRDSARQAEVFRLQPVDFQGAEHLDVTQLQSVIHSRFPKNALAVDLNELRELIEAESWVKEAVVRRRLPNQIEVFLEERTPVAVANIDEDLYVVDSEGWILAPFGPEFSFLDVPIVRGLRSMAVENAREDNGRRMTVYMQVLEDLDSGSSRFSKQISEIDVTDVQRVAVVPNEEPVMINLGNSRFSERYQVFLSSLDLFRELKDQYGHIESVDVTFDNQIVIHTPAGRAEPAGNPGGAE